MRRRDKEKCRDYEGWGLSFQFIQMFFLLFFFFAVMQKFSVEEFRSLVCLNFIRNATDMSMVHNGNE